MFHHNFSFLNFIVDISVILRYDSHKVQKFTEYWNDKFPTVFSLLCYNAQISGCRAAVLFLGFLFLDIAQPPYHSSILLKVLLWRFLGRGYAKILLFIFFFVKCAAALHHFLAIMITDFC